MEQSEARQDWLAHPETQRERDEMKKSMHKTLSALVAKAMESTDAEVAMLAAQYQERVSLWRTLGGKGS